MKSKKKMRLAGIGRKAELLIWSAIFLFPLYWMLCLPFKTESEATARPFSIPRQFNFDNFEAVFQKINIWDGMLNSFLYATLVSVSVMLISSIAAYAIFRMHKKSARLVYRYFVIGLSVPGMCLVVPVYLILKAMGLIGTSWAVVFPCVSGNLVAAIIFIGSFIKAIPMELEEAAAIDGCGPIRCFLHIIFPLLRSGVSTKFTLVFLSMWNDYSSYKLFCLGKSRQPITMMIAGFFNSKWSVHWGEVGAAILVSSLPAIVIYCICNKQLEKALTISSFK